MQENENPIQIARENGVEMTEPESLSQPLICYSFLSKIIAAIIVYRMSLILQTPNSIENIVKTSLAQPMEMDVFFDSLCCYTEKSRVLW